MKLNMNTNEIISKTQIKATLKQLQAEEISKGACIRTLFAGGLSVKEISDITTIKYNHVYNVCRNEVNKNHLEGDLITAREGGTKKQAILEKLQSGLSVTEVSKELGCLYNQVWQIAKANGLTPKQLAAAAQEVK
jgi:hypothetical protein